MVTAARQKQQIPRSPLSLTLNASRIEEGKEHKMFGFIKGTEVTLNRVPTHLINRK